MVYLIFSSSPSPTHLNVDPNHIACETFRGNLQGRNNCQNIVHVLEGKVRLGGGLCVVRVRSTRPSGYAR